MLKFETKPQPTDASSLPHPELVSPHQLFVLVPSSDADSTMLNRRIWKFAHDSAFHVKFIGICNEVSNELATRRALVTMSSLVNHGNVTSDVEVINGNNWVDILESSVTQGDVVLYWDTHPRGSLRSPLRWLLRANLDVPLYIIPGTSTPQDARPAWSTQAMSWIGFIAIVLGFLVLQVKTYQLASSWTMLLVILSTIVELWLLSVWHNWFK